MRKLLADRLFPVESESIENGILCIDDQERVLTVLKPGDEGYNTADVERFEGWIIPGMVNAHCHLELSHLKGIVSEQTGLDGFVEELMQVRSAPEEIQVAAMLDADFDMWNRGIVAVGDISNSARSFPIKEKSNIRYFTFIERFGLNPDFADLAFSTGMDLLKQLKSLSRNTDGNLSPHAPYSVSELLLSKLVAHISHSNGVLSIHNQETASEDEFFKTGGGRMQQRMSNMNISTERFVPSGKSSLETLIPKLPTSNRIQLVHNTFSTDTDIQHAIEQLPQVFWCLCPSANQYIESKLPPLKSLRANHCEITVGTDSLASNHQLDLLAELRLLQQADPSVTSDELIRWSTLNGARLLGFDSELGSFSKGKKPGIVLIEHVDKINGLILPESTSRML